MCSGDWLRLEKVTYLDPTGKRELVWERFVRTSPDEHASRPSSRVRARSQEKTEGKSMNVKGPPGTEVQADSVAIVAITCHTVGDPKESQGIVLVKQYR